MVEGNPADRLKFSFPIYARTTADASAVVYMVLIPAMLPHGLRNTGAGTARAIGFFAGANVVSTFEDSVMPVDQTVLVPRIPQKVGILRHAPPPHPSSRIAVVGQSDAPPTGVTTRPLN